MAVNYGEAIEKAKIEEASVTSKGRCWRQPEPRRVPQGAREPDRIKSWEEHCAWEKGRFEKAARWMETHFEAVGKAVASEDRGRQGRRSRRSDHAG